MKKWWNIRKLGAVAAAAAGIQAAAATEILIYGDIGESWWEETVSAKSFLEELQQVPAQDDLVVRINSFGGSVPDGLAIFNALKRHQGHVTTRVEGVAFSIASLILQAGDTREMAANALVMLHAPWTYAYGNSSELRRTADELDVWATAMATSYAGASGRTKDECLKLLTDGVDHYFTAEEAKAEGWINSITDEQDAAAMAAAVGAIGVCNRYRDVPAAWLQACGGAAAVSAAAISAASAAPTQEASMNHRKFLVLAGLRLMNAAGTDGTQTGGTGSSGQPAPTAAPAAAPAVAAAPAPALSREQVLAQEKQRRDGIAARFAPFLAHAGVKDLLQQLQDDHTVTVEAAGARLLAKLGEGATPVAGGRIVTVADERDKRIDAMGQSIIARSAVVLSKDGPVRVEASNPFRGRKLMALAEACVQALGIRTEGMDQRAIVAAAFTQSGSDFPVLLESVMHKTLQGAYAIQADTWTRFCARGSVSDFREHSRYRVGSLSNLDAKNELGEFKNKTIPDGEKASISASTKGNIINISREAIINDDLGAFVGLAAALGRAAKRTVEADVYATLALNAGMGPTLEDGVTLFHADHANVSTGAPTVTSFEAARVVMSAQKDVSDNDFLALTPAIWLGPDSIVGQAKVVNNSTYDPDAANKLQRANIANGMVRDIVGTPRLSGTPWYFFADPSEAPVLEVAFLDGISEPYLEMEMGFTVDGSRWKARMDYGVAGLDFRGAVRSTGA
ncbi:MAG TPA: ClpP-like prohead protease/major capsid protein fusion protein [Ramlibacter sp.]|nr:ClpP-like prohead protease/major capsid protein fusion protein [Ramlibacter sp.]